MQPVHVSSCQQSLHQHKDTTRTIIQCQERSFRLLLASSVHHHHQKCPFELLWQQPPAELEQKGAPHGVGQGRRAAAGRRLGNVYHLVPLSFLRAVDSAGGQESGPGRTEVLPFNRGRQRGEGAHLHGW